MHFKKFFAALLALTILFCALPFSASAAGTPSVLYVGEIGKAADNLIDKYVDEGRVTVYSVKRSEDYYQLTYDKTIGYVLTFYNGYEMSTIVDKSSKVCGLYCDGDLTVRLDVDRTVVGAANRVGNADITFDASAEYRDGNGAVVTNDGAYGWYVDGTLTIECINHESDMAKLTVNGDLTNATGKNTGIYADMILLNNVEVHANGGNIGAEGKQAIAMIDSALYANTLRSFIDGDDRLFTHSVRTDNLIEIRSKVAALGTLDVDAYYGVQEDNSEMEADPIVYARAYEFENDVNAGNWGTSFNLFHNRSLIPDCMHIYSPVGLATRRITGKEYYFSYLSISGNRATFRRPTPGGGVTMALVLVCGQASYLMDTSVAICSLRWWQYVPYFLSGNWLN